jgi:hypothetical protein
VDTVRHATGDALDMRSNNYRVAARQRIAYLVLSDGPEALVDLVDLPGVQVGRWHLASSHGAR